MTEINPEGFQYEEIVPNPPDSSRPKEEIKIYMIRQNEWGKHVTKQFTPNEESRWDNVVSVGNISEADYLVFISTPSVMPHVMPEKTLWFIGEPTEFGFCKHFWASIPEGAHKYPIEDCGMPAFWHILKNYDYLKNNDFPEKTKDLSWVTTKFGDGTEPPGCQVLSGHKLRADFLKKMIDRHPDKFDLYGRKLLSYFRPGNFKHFGGELADKWDGMKDYRYSIGIENSSQRNYFTGKFNDAILSGCMPIYWGCKNIGELFPKGSYVWLDIEKDDAPERVLEIIQSDYREKHLDELREAKELILEHYNMWAQIAKRVNEVDAKRKL